MRIQVISWPEIQHVWSQHLWPNRTSPIEPTSAMSYQGGYDLENMKFAPIFLGAFDLYTLMGVNSCHLTSDGMMRSRGLYVFPEHRGKGVATLLLNATIDYARFACAEGLWTLPRKESFPTYQSVGFSKTGEWFDEGVEFGPNCYALHNLDTV